MGDEPCSLFPCGPQASADIDAAGDLVLRQCSFRADLPECVLAQICGWHRRMEGSKTPAELACGCRGSSLPDLGKDLVSASRSTSGSGGNVAVELEGPLRVIVEGPSPGTICDRVLLHPELFRGSSVAPCPRESSVRILEFALWNDVRRTVGVFVRCGREGRDIEEGSQSRDQGGLDLEFTGEVGVGHRPQLVDERTEMLSAFALILGSRFIHESSCNR